MFANLNTALRGGDVFVPSQCSQQPRAEVFQGDGNRRAHPSGFQFSQISVRAFAHWILPCAAWASCIQAAINCFQQWLRHTHQAPRVSAVLIRRLYMLTATSIHRTMN
jgi:hypothetical protein